MKRFTDENTTGYTLEQLAELNRRYDARIVSEGPQPDKSLCDHVAERVLAEFDSEVK